MREKKPKDKKKVKLLTGAETKGWIRRNIKVLALFGLFFVGFIFGGVVFSVVGEEEIDIVPVGFVVAKYTESGGVSPEMDFANLEADTTKLHSLTTWHDGREYLSDYSLFKYDSGQLQIDPDGVTMGVPNAIANIPQGFYSSDAGGTQTDEFDTVKVERSFYDLGTGEYQDVTFYNSHVTSQITITIHGDQDIEVESYSGTGDKIGVGSTAEVEGEYNRLTGLALDTKFLGQGIYFKMVFRISVKTLALGEAIHTDPDDISFNGVWWAKVTNVDVGWIESTQGWQGTGDYSGNLEDTMVGIYATCEDALKGENVIPSRDSTTIQLESTLQSHVYFVLEYQVRLGYDYNTQKYVSDGWVYDWANTPLKVQGWKVTVDLTSYICTAYTDPMGWGHEQGEYVNPFQQEDLPDIGWDWFGAGSFADLFKNIWNDEIGKWVVIAIIAVLILIPVGFLLVKGFPLIVRTFKKSGQQTIKEVTK